MKRVKKTRNFSAILTVILMTVFLRPVHAQVSIPERSPLTIFARFGLLGNNPDFKVKLFKKDNKSDRWSVRSEYAAAPELGFGFDLVRFRAAVIGCQLSGLYAQQELIAADSVDEFRVGLPPVGMIRGAVTLSFNGSEPYTMFALPYHSTSEMVVGVSGALLQTVDTKPTKISSDSLGITNIRGGNLVQVIGFFLGFNWRLGESGFVMGVCGSMMWTPEKKQLLSVETGESSPFNTGNLIFDPRTAQFTLGYHF